VPRVLAFLRPSSGRARRGRSVPGERRFHARHWLRAETAPVERSGAAEFALHDEPDGVGWNFAGAAVAMHPV